MFRCYYCKDPVTIKEHKTVLKELGPISILDDEDIDDDCFDGEGNLVVCRSCLEDADIELETSLRR